jgi:hypothetical protein
MGPLASLWRGSGNSANGRVRLIGGREADFRANPKGSGDGRFILESLRFRYNFLWQQGRKLYQSSSA